jgi:hypothetical protein
MNKTIDKNKPNQTKNIKNTCHTQTKYQKHKSNKLSKGTNKQTKLNK